MNNKTRTILFALSVAVMLSYLTVSLGIDSVSAQEVPGSEDPEQEPVTANENTTQEDPMSDELREILDGLAQSVVDLQIENQRLAESSDDESVRDAIEDNDRRIAELIEDINELDPPRQVVEISASDEARMNEIILALVHSDLPLVGVGIDAYTGKISIEVDSAQNTTSTKADILAITGSVPIDITYVDNDATFLSSCNTSTRYCNPVVGGALAEDEYNGQDCTVSIGVVRSTIFGTDNGILIPNHCNQHNYRYYQADNDIPHHYFGDSSVYGGPFCDCRFVATDSRSINTYKVTIGSQDYTTLGKSDIPQNSLIFTYGAQSQQLDYGRVEQVNQWKNFYGVWYSDLYKISGLDTQDRDSGAPIISISNQHYGGMNIGFHDGYNYAHDWSFMKSRLQLQN